MINLTEDERRAKYKKIVLGLPHKKTKDKMEFISNLIYCSPTTAEIWYSENTPRPIPTQKLRLFKEKLKLPKVVAELKKLAAQK